MNKNDFLKILSLEKKERYTYFISKSVAFEEIWGLYNDGWAMLYNDSKEKLIPFWPKKIFAEVCVADIWKDYHPEPIEIYNFVENWIPDMKEKNIQPAIFCTPKFSYFSANINVLLNDLKSELYICK